MLGSFAVATPTLEFIEPFSVAIKVSGALIRRRINGVFFFTISELSKVAWP